MVRNVVLQTITYLAAVIVSILVLIFIVSRHNMVRKNFTNYNIIPVSYTHLGAVSVAVGARSAIFAPFRRLRLIILDEEHEPSYYSEDAAPHYHAAEIARCV